MPSQTNLTLPPNPIKALRAEVSKVVRRTAESTEGDAKISMTGPKSGPIYRRKGGTHQASAPGEAPAVDEGNIFNTTKAAEVNETTWVVAVAADEGVWMEFGTRTVAPRPFLGPALEKHRAAFEAAIKALIS